MKQVLFLSVVSIFLFFSVPCEAQFWPFKKRSQAEKATEDLQNRRREAGEGNMFNPAQSFGGRWNDARDDHIWSASTAFTSYSGAGNVSLTTPSRYGLSTGFELFSFLGGAYWTPNIYFKREISSEKIRVSSLHGLYTSYPGLKAVSSGKETFLADSLTATPFVLATGHRIILSRPFYSKVDCNPKQPYLILTTWLGLNYGYSFHNEDIHQREKHLFTPRTPALWGEGVYLTLAVRADWEALSGVFLRGELRTLAGNYDNSRFVWEQQSLAEMFLARGMSVSAGYLLSYSNWESGNLGFFPFLDLTVYFGRKQGRNRGLFGERMF